MPKEVAKAKPRRLLDEIAYETFGKSYRSLSFWTQIAVKRVAKTKRLTLKVQKRLDEVKK